MIKSKHYCAPSTEIWTHVTLQQDAFISASTVRRQQPTELGHVRLAINVRLQISASLFHQRLPILSDDYETPI